MLHLLEVVGTSPVGFSEAVQSAVAETVRAGHAAHFFQVVEQRGSIRDNRIREYQVVLKVAVEKESEPA